MGRISNAILGNRYTVTFPDGTSHTVNAGAHEPTHAVIGKLDGVWEANPCLTLTEAQRDLPWLRAQGYTDLSIVSLTRKS